MKIAFLIRALVSLLMFGSVLAPAIASAQVDAAGDAGAAAAVKATGATTGAPVSVTVTKRTKAMEAAIAKADKEIARRVAALNDANTRVQAMQQVTAAFKQNLATAIQAQISAFTALQAKIDADTDLATLKTDIQSITASYRVFALVLPQVRIAAMADREVSLAAMLNTLGIKLQARIASAQSAGQDTTALSAALADMSTRLSNASSQAQSAVSTTASLAPDNGDKTIMTSNAAAIKTARASLVAAQKDLQAARKDADTILKGLKNAKPAATSTAPTTR